MCNCFDFQLAGSHAAWCDRLERRLVDLVEQHNVPLYPGKDAYCAKCRMRWDQVFYMPNARCETGCVKEVITLPPQTEWDAQWEDARQAAAGY